MLPNTMEAGSWFTEFVTASLVPRAHLHLQVSLADSRFFSGFCLVPVKADGVELGAVLCQGFEIIGRLAFLLDVSFCCCCPVNLAVICTKENLERAGLGPR